jgi:hypothetical protein
MRYPGICMAGLRKIKKILSQDRSYGGRHSNLAPLEYKSLLPDKPVLWLCLVPDYCTVQHVISFINTPNDSKIIAVFIILNFDAYFTIHFYLTIFM